MIHIHFVLFQLNGKTALMRASQYGRTDIVKLLLEAGADKHREDAVCTSCLCR